MKKKTVSIILALVLLAAAALTGCGAGSSENAVPVESVAMITGIGNSGAYDRFAGMVVSQNTIEYKKDDTKSVLEIHVEEGDSVSVGQKLFTYDLEEMQLAVDKAKLELEQMNNKISTSRDQIIELEYEKSNASSSDQLSYTIEIQSLEADISETEYNIKLKESELARLEQSLGNPDVLSTVDGIVKSINADGTATDSSGMPLPFMTITETGTYRVKGHINELAVGTLAEGSRVIIRSRTDSTAIWGGQISVIEWDNPVSGSNNYYYVGGDEMTTSNKYPFYIEMDTVEGLILGQHVYIEPDLGQGTGSDILALPAYYIIDAETDPWVWAADGDKLEKRSVTLGTYLAETDSYEITAGLTVEDYIAFPDASHSAGMPVTRYDENSFSNGIADEGITDDGIADDGIMDDEPVYDDGIAFDGGVGTMDLPMAR